MDAGVEVYMIRRPDVSGVKADWLWRTDVMVALLTKCMEHALDRSSTEIPITGAECQRSRIDYQSVRRT